MPWPRSVVAPEGARTDHKEWSTTRNLNPQKPAVSGPRTGMPIPVHGPDSVMGFLARLRGEMEGI